MIGVSCVPISGKARTVVLFSRSLVINVESLSDLLGVTWVRGKGESLLLIEDYGQGALRKELIALFVKQIKKATLRQSNW